MLISSSIPNFVNGVSQQPFTLRLNSQGDTQENGLSTVSQGLKKRPPTKHLKKIIQAASVDDCYIHTINRDENERFIVVITPADLKVYDINGVEQVVNFPNGRGYLAALDYPKDFAALTVADYTFIVNKTVTTAKSTAKTPTRPYEALINVKTGNYGKDYNIYIDGNTVAGRSTPDGSASSDSTKISTDYIASNLNSALASSGINSPTWTRSRYGSTIYIAKSTDFTIRTEDGFNGQAMVAIKGKLQKFADLPSNGCQDGVVVQITGTGSGENGSDPFDSYYVQYSTEGGSLSNGVWKECAAPNINLSFDAATMPHVLIREANGTFTFKRATWKNRIVGDDDSNPFPSFIGHPISDVFFYRNRLGFLADEAVIFSESGEYFNFMRTTVTQLLDSDPIDVNASHTKVSLLKHAVPFNKQLLLFSEQTQFIIEQNDLLTPKSIGIKVATEFPCNTTAKPVGIGKNIYFAVNKGEWSAFREYFADLNNITNDSLDITGHIPQYIPSNVYKIAAAPNEDILVALSIGDKSSLYVYKYFWANNDKLQSSWSKWTFGSECEVLNVDFISSDMYLLIKRPDGIHLEKATVSLAFKEVDEPYPIHLDRKVSLVSSNMDYGSGYTTISKTAVGYDPAYGSYQVVVKSHPTIKPGTVYDAVWNGSTIRVKGDITGGTYAFGRKYTFKYQLSTITIHSQTQTGGQKSDTEGRLQLRKIAFNYADSGYFKVKVTPAGRETYEYVYSGKVLGQLSGTMGQYNISSGRFLLPIISRNIGTVIALENDTPLPSTFLSADWEGFFVKRSRPV